MSSYMTDISGLLGTGGTPDIKHNTSKKKDNTSLEMTDFLNLMVVQLQNQSIDESMDTSDMLNQLVQMQMITAMTNMTDASVMSYASSLVGKEVTIGDYSSGQLEERVVTITGTGLSDGKQVVFAGDEVFDLSSVMAVGRLPGSDTDNNVEGDKDSEDEDKVEGAGDNKDPDAVDKDDKPGSSTGVDTSKPADGTEDSGESSDSGDTGNKPVSGSTESTAGGSTSSGSGSTSGTGSESGSTSGTDTVEGTGTGSAASAGTETAANTGLNGGLLDADGNVDPNKVAEVPETDRISTPSI